MIILDINEIQKRKEIIKVTNKLPDILHKYGVEVKRGRCRGICHAGKDLNAKVTEDYLWCYVCNKSMDIFDVVMHFNNCDFWTAFELLGGTERLSFTATVKANKAKKERELRFIQEQQKKAETRQMQSFITAYRNIIAEEEPLSELWCYCQNRLQYQLYLLELYGGDQSARIK